MRVIVVGGGMAGMVAALRLAQNGAQVVLLDGASRPGGKLAVSAELRPEGDLDVGAESMLARRPEGVALVRELGLGAELVHPGPAAPLIVSRGVLHRMPPGTVMGVPVDLPALERMRGLLTDAEVDEAIALGSRPAAPVGADLSVGAWVTARLGRPVLDRVVEPLLGGVYAGHADDLSLQATVPALWARAVAGGPLLEAPAGQGDATEPVAAAAGQQVFAGIEGGVGRLPLVLAARLADLGVTVRTGATVRVLARSRGGWRVETGPAPMPEQLYADALVLAVPAAAAAKLLAEPVPDAGSGLAAIRSSSVAVIGMLVPREQLSGLDASGVLVPPVEGRLVKAITFSSQKWPWLDARLAPQGLHAVRLSVGRAGEEQRLQLTDDELVAAAVTDLPWILGRSLLPVRSQVQRWGGALPQYAPGHVRLVAEIRRSVSAAGGLAVCGAALDGVGVPAVIASGERAAADLLRTHQQFRETMRS